MPKNYIVIHHSASSDHGTLKDFYAIKRWHTEHNGWRDIGYHWVIERVNGKLVAIPGRSEGDTGAHCPSRNTDGIGICMVGNYQDTMPGGDLYQFVAGLCKQIMSRHPIREIGGHRDYTATACPGQYFDIEKVRQLVKGGSAVQDVKVVVKGKELPGKLIDGQTWAPVRALVDAMNETVTWQEETKTVVVK